MINPSPIESSGFCESFIIRTKTISRPRHTKQTQVPSLLTPFLSTCSMRTFSLRVPGSRVLGRRLTYVIEPEKPNQDLPIHTIQKRRKWLKSCILVALLTNSTVRAEKKSQDHSPLLSNQQKSSRRNEVVIFILMIYRIEKWVFWCFFPNNTTNTKCEVFSIPTTNSDTNCVSNNSTQFWH